jgi:hypothetical protein
MTVTEIQSQPFCFEVSSRSRPGLKHTVNWLRRDCTCETFSYKNRECRETTGKNYLCPHLIASKDHCWETILAHTREQLG